MASLPVIILTVFAPFSTIFLKPKTASKAVLLLAGAILCRGGRTVCAALKILGMQGEVHFDKYHRVLSRASWHPLEGGKILLQQLMAGMTGPLVIAVDEHIERRHGRKIKAIGCYRDAVRSSQRHIVKCFGLKWITVMVLKQYSWIPRLLALPFLTILASSEKANKKAGKRHKTTIDWAVQIVKILHRWFPALRIILTADGGFANVRLAWICLKYNICLVTRLRLDARLFDFPPEYTGRGRPPKRGQRLFSPKQMFKQSGLKWTDVKVKWYGGKIRQVAYATITCLWAAQGDEPLPIRLTLLKDLEGEYEPIALMGIDALFQLTAIEIIEWFVARWNQEVTHREVRDHLGVETQRQWSDKAIARTTPALFGLYSLIVLMADHLQTSSSLKLGSTAWYKKKHPTFADMLREVRRHLWSSRYFNYLYGGGDHEETLSPERIAALIDELSEVA
jgi:hypothetical protein